MVAVMQKPQPIAHPTCVDTHSVRRTLARGPSSSSASGSKLSGPASSGMYTLSMNLPSCVRIRYLRVPSVDSCTASMSSVVSRAWAASRSRNARGRSVMASSEAAPFRCSQA